MYKSVTLSIVTAISLLTAVTIANASSDNTARQAKPAVEGMLLPFMNPSKGRKLYASKGCVVCHSVNGIGGVDAPALDAKTMPSIMDPFEFAAKMWRGAGTMITMQEDELGEQIDFTGQELANIIAFVHSASEQKKFSRADIPPRIARLMGHPGDDSEEQEEKKHD